MTRGESHGRKEETRHAATMWEMRHDVYVRLLIETRRTRKENDGNVSVGPREMSRSLRSYTNQYRVLGQRVRTSVDAEARAH